MVNGQAGQRGVFVTRCVVQAHKTDLDCVIFPSLVLMERIV